MCHPENGLKESVCEPHVCRQVDAVLARMTMLKERIEATESCIALDLDHRRNELVAYNLVRAAPGLMPRARAT